MPWTLRSMIGCEERDAALVDAIAEPEEDRRKDVE
jgi:hypothetical protein